MNNQVPILVKSRVKAHTRTTPKGKKVNVRAYTDSRTKKDTRNNFRQATKNDFKVGVTLYDSEGNGFTIRRKYDDGIWESNGKVHFVNEAKHYRVKSSTRTISTKTAPHTSLNKFRAIVKESNSKEEFLRKISKMNNVPDSVNGEFYRLYSNFYNTQMKRVNSTKASDNKPKVKVKQKIKVNQKSEPESKKKYMEQGGIIHAQVGQRALVMMGANSLSIGKNDNGYGFFSFKTGKNPKGINYVKIQLNAKDSYDLEFGKIHGDKYKVISTAKDTYVDNLHTTLKHHTGLETSLGMIDKSITTGDNKMSTNLIKYPALAKAIGLNVLDGSQKVAGHDSTKYPALAKTMDKLNKSIEFKVSGQKLKDAIDTKISVCKGELAILEKEYPPVAERELAKVSENVDVAERDVPVTKLAPAKYNEHWKVSSKKRHIEELERYSRNINVKLSYELDKYELNQFGL